MRIGRLVASLALAALCLNISAAAGQTLPIRQTIWNLKLGSPLEALPPVEAFRAYACGSNGGPPRQQIRTWSEFTKCRPEASGLREVYFEYDDEREYIARALDLTSEVARWTGTTEQGFPVIVSALFDESGVLRGVRMVSDPRPDYRVDTSRSESRTRREAHLLGAMMAPRFDIQFQRDCTALPPAQGESTVGTEFIKNVCERVDERAGRRVVLAANFFRKPGHLAWVPDVENQLTEGQFESSARLEIFLARP